MSDGTPLRAVCLAGPTTSGKSALAMAFAERHPVEIVSVDSAQVYRGMDIGTAKPSAAERSAVPHHLIDILDPSERYSAARFAADASRLVREIHARGRIALLVGGTMLYFKALREGLDAMPEADAGIRAAIDAEAAQHGWPALHAELQRIDPPSAARIAPGDSQRIQRALEVWRSSGKPLSQWQARRAGAAAARGNHDWPLIALEPSSRAWLHARIGERFRAMLDAGLVDEVRVLRSRGDLHPGLPSMRSVGYRQVWQALDAAAGDDPEARDCPDDLAEAGSAATRQLAKRQMTWLRSIPERIVVRCDASDALQRGLDALDRCLASLG